MVFLTAVMGVEMLLLSLLNSAETLTVVLLRAIANHYHSRVFKDDGSPLSLQILIMPWTVLVVSLGVIFACWLGLLNFETFVFKISKSSSMKVV